jgi:fucose permease
LFWKREEETVDNEAENKEENEEMKQEKAEELESKENENVRIFIIIIMHFILARVLIYSHLSQPFSSLRHVASVSQLMRRTLTNETEAKAIFSFLMSLKFSYIPFVFSSNKRA